MAKVNMAAVSYIDVLVDFIEQQHLVPPSRKAVMVSLSTPLLCDYIVLSSLPL
jgi:hypothetical protein